MTVPLLVRTQVLGAITFVGGSDGNGETAEALSMAEDLAASVPWRGHRGGAWRGDPGGSEVGRGSVFYFRLPVAE